MAVNYHKPKDEYVEVYAYRIDVHNLDGTVDTYYNQSSYSWGSYAHSTFKGISTLGVTVSAELRVIETDEFIQDTTLNVAIAAPASFTLDADVIVPINSVKKVFVRKVKVGDYNGFTEDFILA